MTTIKGFTSLTASDIADILGHDPEEWEDTDPTPSFSYMGGYYISSNGPSLDEFAVWYGKELVAIDVLHEVGLPRTEQFWRFIAILVGQEISRADPVLLCEGFQHWRRSTLNDGSRFCEVFDGVHYGSWEITAPGLVRSFTFEHFPLIVKNERSDNFPLGVLLADGIPPWDSNRFGARGEVSFEAGSDQ
jgi:hypothetical protein